MKKALPFIIVYSILILSLIYVKKCRGQEVWKANPKYTKEARQDSSKAQVKHYQCWGTTVKGERCKRKVNADHGFCYQHAAQK